MTTDDIADYHSTRALAELNLGLTAKGMPASRAHLQLASLHLQRVRESKIDQPKPLLDM